MATKQFFATGDFKYGTRMMRAGDPVNMDAPTARLYRALGKIGDRKPGAAQSPVSENPYVGESEGQTARAAEVAAEKPARKRTTRRKK